MAVDKELEVNRKNTSAFIAVKPTTIALCPRKRIATPGGGFKYEDQPLRAPQTFRIIELGMQTTPPILTLTDGKQREAEFWLLGEWNAEVQIDDYWTEFANNNTGRTDRTWIVGDVVRTNFYEVRALVAERGK